MRLLSIFNRYKQYGGEETVVNMIDSLLKEKHPESQSFIYSTDELIGHSLLEKTTSPLRGLYNCKIASQLKMMQKKHKFKAWLIHNIFPNMSPAVLATAYKLDVPVIFMLHNYRLGCINGFFLKDGKNCQLCLEKGPLQGVKYKCWHNNRLLSAYSTLFQYICRQVGIFEKTSAFIALSKAQIPVLNKIGVPADKIFLIDHFVDIPDTFTPPPKNGDVLFMGRLSKEKGAELLIKAWKNIPTSGRNLVIAGTGSEEEHLKTIVKQHKLANVHFSGFIDKEHHHDIWKNISFYAMPSTWEETAAMSILEGWAQGKPALAFNIGAASDYLQNPSTGWLANLFLPNDLEDKLSQALNTSEQRLNAMSRYVRELVTKNHSSDTWLSRFEALYYSVIKHQHA